MTAPRPRPVHPADRLGRADPGHARPGLPGRHVRPREVHCRSGRAGRGADPVHGLAGLVRRPWVAGSDRRADVRPRLAVGRSVARNPPAEGRGIAVAGIRRHPAPRLRRAVRGRPRIRLGSGGVRGPDQCGSHSPRSVELTGRTADGGSCSSLPMVHAKQFGSESAIERRPRASAAMSRRDWRQESSGWTLERTTAVWITTIGDSLKDKLANVSLIDALKRM